MFSESSFCSQPFSMIDHWMLRVADTWILCGVQIKSSSVPQLPQHRELLSALRPYHSILVGESYLARKRPVYECTDSQVVYWLSTSSSWFIRFSPIFFFSNVQISGVIFDDYYFAALSFFWTSLGVMEWTYKLSALFFLSFCFDLQV